ncbi:MAG: cation transporter [Pseudonocardiaceae bacterium]|uniref:cation diffusion facilitator family transporter n=1 Tax=Afipia sp. 1NLS2 TaxID=666684 RepID=UPI0001DA0D5C|nr:cation transporter [Afipia sp. 1NLS2]EFI52691.1 cation diffusion facilitator family transporter [Afipia sp. 1NLS2]MBE0704681.1 cation transporter [Afipia sp.]RTL64994.1 MAG: cation transporter [Pseudonocardiaceae bacterium]
MHEKLKPTSEQAALKLSILVTALTGLTGVAAGLAIGSRAILFDGMYSFIDVMLTFGALTVSKLLMQEPTLRFQFGYWHLEPLVGVIESAILVTVCVYAAINGLQGLTSGGQTVSYEIGVVWAATMFVSGMAMAIYMGRLARLQRSILLTVDARGWLLSALLSFALLVAYGIAVVLDGSAYSRLIPFVDPIALLCMSLVLFPIPLKTLVSAIRDVLEVAPKDLDQSVRSVLDALMVERGFLRYSSHVAQVGRVRFIEIHILVGADFRVETVHAVDAIRREVAARLGVSWPQAWLTVDLTADPEWV